MASSVQLRIIALLILSVLVMFPGRSIHAQELARCMLTALTQGILENLRAQLSELHGKFDTYRLEQIREAFEYVASGQKIGNVIIEMD
jgi:hypothetical protein